MKILKNRLYNTLDDNQPPSRAGFRRGYSAVDHVQTVKQIIEKSIEYNLEVHFLLNLVDFQKAFDTVAHECLWKAMADQGCEREIMRVLHTVQYRGIDTRVSSPYTRLSQQML